MSSDAVTLARGRLRRIGAAAQLRQFWLQWRQARRDRRDLARFSEREMRDLGITRADIERELARPLRRYPFP